MSRNNNNRDCTQIPGNILDQTTKLLCQLGMFLKKVPNQLLFVRGE